MNCNVRNANYDRVMSVIESFLNERYGNVCSCTRCVSEIAALALNYLPPHYYCDDKNVIKIGSPLVMVETAVIEAIDVVMKKPNHGDQRLQE